MLKTHTNFHTAHCKLWAHTLIFYIFLFFTWLIKLLVLHIIIVRIKRYKMIGIRPILVYLICYCCTAVSLNVVNIWALTQPMQLAYHRLLYLSWRSHIDTPHNKNNLGLQLQRNQGGGQNLSANKSGGQNLLYWNIDILLSDSKKNWGEQW